MLSRLDKRLANSEHENTFKLICDYARTKNRDALNQLVNSGTNINLALGDITSVMQLAIESDVEAVDFLIHEFNANIHGAIEGYAASGNSLLVHPLIKTKAHRDFAALGFALAGRVTEVNELIFQGASPIMAALGYAEGGHHEEVNHIMAKYKGDNVRLAVISGYAEGGYVNRVNALIEKEADKNEAIRSYAKQGRVDEVNQLLATGASKDYAAEGYANGGYESHANQLIKVGANPTSLFSGFTASHNYKQADNLVNSKLVELVDAVMLYARFGNANKVNAYIKQAPIAHQSALMQAALFIYADMENHEQVQHLISTNKLLCAFAAERYAKNGLITRVNAMIAMAIAEKDERLKALAFNFVVKQYENHFKTVSDNQRLMLVADTDNLELRKLLIAKAKPYLKTMSEDEFRLKANITKKIENEYKLNFNQARSLTQVGARAWLLQGPQALMGANYNMIEEIFFKISAFVLGLPANETKVVFDAVHNHLFFSIKNEKTNPNPHISNLLTWFNGYDENKEIKKCRERTFERCPSSSALKC